MRTVKLLPLMLIVATSVVSFFMAFHFSFNGDGTKAFWLYNLGVVFFSIYVIVFDYFYQRK